MSAIPSPLSNHFSDTFPIRVKVIQCPRPHFPPISLPSFYDPISDRDTLITTLTTRIAEKLTPQQIQANHQNLSSDRVAAMVVVWGGFNERHKNRTVVHANNVQQVLKLMEKRPGCDVLEAWPAGTETQVLD